MAVEQAKWNLYFDDEAVNRRGSQVRILLVSSKEVHVPFAIKLNFLASYNVTEYEACTLGLKAAINRIAQEIEVYEDSAVIIQKFQGKWPEIEMKSYILTMTVP